VRSPSRLPQFPAKIGSATSEDGEAVAEELRAEQPSGEERIPIGREDPDRDLEPVEAGVVAVGVVPAADEEHHDDAHGEQAGDPADREGRPRGTRRAG
jgi:hypothetical protein